MKKTKMEKGITLIALIITIVVLLILAVVTIGAIRESSIITHAQNAKDSWNKGSTQEELNLKVAELKMGIAEKPSDYEFTLTVNDNETAYIDDGKISKILSGIGLKINDEQLDAEGHLITQSVRINLNNEENLRSYVKCTDENGKNAIALIEFTPEKPYDEEYTSISGKIQEIRLWGELGSTIYDINNDIYDNYENYRITFEKDNETNDEFFNRFLTVVYQTLINNGIIIESTEFLNEEKNGFKDFKVLIEENLVYGLDDGGSTLGMNIKCSKGGEELTVIICSYMSSSSGKFKMRLEPILVDKNDNILLCDRYGE